MKNSLLIFTSFIIFSCSQTNEKKDISNDSISIESDKLNSLEIKDRISLNPDANSFKSKGNNNTGIILSNKLNLYNHNKEIIGSSENLFGVVVSIDSISKQKHTLKESDDRCDLHNFVKINSEQINGWVFGEYVFENDKRDTTFTVDNITFEFKPTNNFNIGVYDEKEDMLSFCGDGNRSPVILYNSKFNKNEYIPIKGSSELYNYNYLTYDSHDGWIDELKNIDYRSDTLHLEVNREYQEGSKVISLDIIITDSSSFGVVTNVIEIKPELIYE
ncbi:MAG: hypothetical protein ACI8YO_002213 [Gammaproteobacteria bacterium]|jgi:hypothetical protein